MTDRQRIEQMATEGRITRAEADRLLQVLDELDGLDRDVGSVERAAAEAQQSAGAGGAAPVANDQPAAGEAGAGYDEAYGAAAYGADAPNTATRSDADAAAPGGHFGASAAGTYGHGPSAVTWLDIDLFFGDVDIVVDPQATEPRVTLDGAGSVELQRTSRGYGLGTTDNANDSFLDKILGNFRRGDTNIILPPDFGLNLRIKAGDISVHGALAALTGTVAAGSIDVDEVHGIDLTVSAGDIDLGLRLAGGQHRLTAAAGDLNVRLLDGTDAQLSGRVSMGSLSLPDGWPQYAQGLGSHFEHTLGNGTGSLRVELGTGDLDIRLRHG
mgnify:CR=1 FL=1